MYTAFVDFWKKAFCKFYRWFSPEPWDPNHKHDSIDEANLTKIIYYYKNPRDKEA